MAPKKTGIINVVNSGFQNLGFFNSPYLSALFNGVGSVLHQNNYKMLFQIFKEQDGTLHAAEITKGQKADGIIYILFAVNLKFLMGEILPFLKSTGVPFVIIHSFDCPVGCPSVGLDSMQGGYLGTEHLIKHGYETIGFIVHHEAHHNVNALEGYRKAHHQFVMPVQEKYVLPGKGWTIEGGWKIGDEIIKSGRDLPRALYVNHGPQARGIIKRFREEGIRVPEDLAVVGFEDGGHEEYCECDMTVVSQPCVEKGAMAAQMLLKVMDGKLKMEDNPTEILKLSLKVGKTCGCHAEKGDKV